MKRLLLMLWIVVMPVLRMAASNDIAGATTEKLLGGAENLKIFTEAKDVTVYRIIEDEKPDPKKSQLIDGLNCKPEPRKVGPAEIQKLRTAFIDMKNFGGMYLCDFDPGIIVRCKTDAGTVDMVVCLYCGEMVIFRDGKLVRRELQWAQTRFSLRKEAKKAFAAIAKQAFPGDPAFAR